MAWSRSPAKRLRLSRRLKGGRSCFQFSSVSAILTPMLPDSEGAVSRPNRAGQFPQTLWSMVLMAGKSPSDRSQEALASLCQAYWFPLYAYLRRQGKTQHDAQDLTQGFLLHM